jgi:hypothetical protein
VESPRSRTMDEPDALQPTRTRSASALQTSHHITCRSLRAHIATSSPRRPQACERPAEVKNVIPFLGPKGQGHRLRPKQFQCDGRRVFAHPLFRNTCKRAAYGLDAQCVFISPGKDETVSSREGSLQEKDRAPTPESEYLSPKQMPARSRRDTTPIGKQRPQ